MEQYFVCAKTCMLPCNHALFPAATVPTLTKCMHTILWKGEDLGLRKEPGFRSHAHTQAVSLPVVVRRHSDSPAAL